MAENLEKKRLVFERKLMFPLLVIPGRRDRTGTEHGAHFVKQVSCF